VIKKVKRNEYELIECLPKKKKKLIEPIVILKKR